VDCEVDFWAGSAGLDILQRACARVIDDDVHTVQAAAQKPELLKRQAALV
jgi:hypothetical protein